MTRATRRNLDRLNRRMDKFGRGMRKVGIAVGVATAIAVGGFVDVARAGIEFEQAITNVGAVALQTREQIAPIEAQQVHLLGS